MGKSLDDIDPDQRVLGWETVSGGPEPPAGAMSEMIAISARMFQVELTKPGPLACSLFPAETA
jgi:hypothetical protein